MTGRGLAALVVGLASAGVVGYLLAGRGTTRRSAPATSAAPPAAQLEALDRAALRAMLREELIALRGTHQGGEPASLPAPAAPTKVPDQAPAEATADFAPTAEQDQRYESGRQLLDGALTRGTWTRDDGRAFRAVLASVTPEQRRELLAALLPALNEGRLAPTTQGPPF